MDFLSILKDAVKECSRVIKFGAGIQAKARSRLINDLQNICSKVETAYSNVLARLKKWGQRAIISNISGFEY